jgi:hypothetical protein
MKLFTRLAPKPRIRRKQKKNLVFFDSEDEPPTFYRAADDIETPQMSGKNLDADKAHSLGGEA